MERVIPAISTKKTQTVLEIIIAQNKDQNRNPRVAVAAVLLDTFSTVFKKAPCQVFFFRIFSVSQEGPAHNDTVSGQNVEWMKVEMDNVERKDIDN